MKTVLIGIFAILIIGIVISCKQESDKKIFENVLNDERVNTKEVGLREGIEFFQIMENGKTGFSDLDGNTVIEPIYESAEMFSENYAAVEMDEKWGLIDKEGNLVIEPKYNYLGSMHEGLMSFRENEKYGFIDINENVMIEPKFDWVDEFSEGYCVVRNDDEKLGSGKNQFIDKTGEVVFGLEFNYAQKFENGKAKVELNKEWFYIDTEGKTIKVSE